MKKNWYIELHREELESSGVLDKTLFPSEGNKENKGALLNQIVEDLMKNCESILAVIIADWQGLSFASKLPGTVNEEEISATTLFTLEGAEGTRKELAKTLLGNKLSYLILVTERQGKLAYMIIFPIADLGYIACISHIREDMGVIIQNVKSAAQKAATSLEATCKENHQLSDTIEQQIAPKYDTLMKKLEALKNVKLPFLEGSQNNVESPISSVSTCSSTDYVPYDVPMIEAPPITGPPLPPDTPLDFIEVDTDFTELEPELLSDLPVSKYQITFKDAKNIKYTVIVTASNEIDAEVRIRDRENFHDVEILGIQKLE